MTSRGGHPSELAPPEDYQDEARILWGSALAAFVIEFVILTAAGFQSHWMTHPRNAAEDDAKRYIEAEIFEVPKNIPKLIEEKHVAVPTQREATISKTPGAGKPAPKTVSLPEQNVTEAGSPVAAKHGPISLFAPPPVIPDYLKSQDLNASVVIDFYVSAQGVTTPKLVGSSGNEELDAIAIASAKRWQFRPAEDNRKAIDAKVRLRILFEVH